MFHVKHDTPPALGFLEEAIAHEKRRDLFRERPPVNESLRTFCSNDYLGLASRPAPPEPCGSGGSRLLAGDRGIHVLLETAAADLVHQPTSLVFTSGYAANVGLLSALAGPNDLIVSDALNHASLIDGARLSRARIAVVPHLNLDAIARALDARGAGRAFVVTESYFSMDADSPDLPVLRALCDERGAALIVDEAHALGVLGTDGRGLCAERGVRADALVGTFGKAFGAAGAFVAGCPALALWLWNRARPFVFSTGLSPATAAAALSGLRRAGQEPWRRTKVLQAASQLRDGLGALGADLRGFGHIVPWVVGDPADATRLALALQARGVDVRAIRPPSVPAGTSRLRFTVTAMHTTADIEHAIAAVASLSRGAERGLVPRAFGRSSLAALASGADASLFARGALPPSSEKAGGP
jgi:8-amino-7-oxononanoate synthase